MRRASGILELLFGNPFFIQRMDTPLPSLFPPPPPSGGGLPRSDPSGDGEQGSLPECWFGYLCRSNVLPHVLRVHRTRWYALS